MNSIIRDLIRPAMESTQADDYINPHLDTDVPPQQSEAYIEATVSEEPQVIEACDNIETSMESLIGSMERLENIASSLEDYSTDKIDTASMMALTFSMEDAVVNDTLDLSTDIAKIKEEKEEASKPELRSKIVEMAKKIFNTIMDFLQSMWRRVSDFGIKLLGAGQQLLIRAKRIVADMAKRDMSIEPTHSTIEAGPFVADISIGTDLLAANVEDIVKRLVAASKAANELDNRLIDAYDRDLNILKAGLQSNDIRNLERALNSNLALGPAFRQLPPTDDRTIVFQSGVMPGNKTIQVTYRANIINGRYYGVRYTTAMIDAEKEDQKDVVSTQMHTMSKTEIEHAAAELTKLVDGLKEGQRISSRLKSTVGKINPLRTLIATPTGTAILGAFTRRYSAVGRATTLMNTQLVRAGLSVLRWADTSLQEYPLKAA